LGIITDGDLRRMLEKNINFQQFQAKDIMINNPKTIEKNELAVKALQTMREERISQLIVFEDNIYLGILHLHDLLKEGIV
jgi:arabinose-5-phosphate isomerase